MSTATEHRDYAPLERLRRRSGWFLRCPGCHRFVRSLFGLGDGRIVCGRCRDTQRYAKVSLHRRYFRQAGSPRVVWDGGSRR